MQTSQAHGHRIAFGKDPAITPVDQAKIDLRIAQGKAAGGNRNFRLQGKSNGASVEWSAKQRSGYSKKIGFEGGQMPLQRVVPKSGFKNINRVEYKGINLDVLQRLAEKTNLTVISKETLVEAGMASKNDRIKILGNGTLSVKLDVKANAFSKGAKEAIEKLQGTTEIL